MASWVLRCPKCRATFFHSEIESTLANFFVPKKPKFPEGGQTLPCKNCGHTSIYQRNELIYRR